MGEIIPIRAGQPVCERRSLAMEAQIAASHAADLFEQLAKEKEAEASGVALNGSSDEQAEAGWELMGHAPDEQSTIVRDIPVLPSKP